MRGDAIFAVCGLFCLYPLIFFALPAFLIGRYKPKLRSPIQFDDRITSKDQAKEIIRKRVRPDPVGFGSGPD